MGRERANEAAPENANEAAPEKASRTAPLRRGPVRKADSGFGRRAVIRRMRKALMHIEQGLSGAVEIPHLLVVVDQIALNEIAVVGSCFGLGVDLPQQNRGDDSRCRPPSG